MATHSVLTKTYPSLTAVCHATVKAAPCGLDAKSVAQFMGKPYQTLMSELSRQEGHKFGADLIKNAPEAVDAASRAQST